MTTDALFPAALDSDLRTAVQVPTLALTLDGVRASARLLADSAQSNQASQGTWLSLPSELACIEARPDESSTER